MYEENSSQFLMDMCHQIQGIYISSVEIFYLPLSSSLSFLVNWLNWVGEVQKNIIKILDVLPSFFLLGYFLVFKLLICEVSCF
jgi:hypothetical protein